MERRWSSEEETKCRQFRSTVHVFDMATFKFKHLSHAANVFTAPFHFLISESPGSLAQSHWSLQTGKAVPEATTTCSSSSSPSSPHPPPAGRVPLMFFFTGCLRNVYPTWPRRVLHAFPADSHPEGRKLQGRKLLGLLLPRAPGRRTGTDARVVAIT